MAGIVEGGDGRGIGGDAEVMGPVVLDEEGAVVAHDASTCSRGGRPLRPGGIRIVRLRVEQPRAGLVEGAGQVLGVRAVGTAGHRNNPDTGLRRGPDRPPVRRGFHQQRLPGRPTSARNTELSPLWLPGSTITSRGVGGATPAGVAARSSCANQDCSSGRPAAGGRDRAASPRAARVRAARTSRSGRSSRSG